MTEWKDLVTYYDEHYQLATSWSLQPGAKIFLGDKEN
jgi:hypothetical protein